MKDLARHPRSLAAKNEALAVDRNFHFIQVVQISDDVGPLQFPLLSFQSILPFLAKQQRQERAKHVPANRFIGLVKDRPGIQQRFDRAEDIRFQKDGEAERFTTGPPATVQSDPKQELRCWHLPQVDWPVADRLVRVVKTVRIEHKRQVTVSQDGDHLTKSKVDVALESTNYYATNFELGAIPPTFIQQLSRSRWRIDAEVFQTITTDCHLKHPAVHQSTALIVLAMIRVMAYALSMVFYCRQVCSQVHGPCDGFHEFAKRLAYGFIALSPNTS